MTTRKFDLLAGAACLDLVNTCDRRDARSGEPIDDFLADPADLLGFLSASSIAIGQELRALEELEDAALRRLLREAKKLREALHALFLRLARKQPIREPEIEPLNEWIAKLGGRHTLRVQKGSVQLDRRREAAEDTLVPFLDSALETLRPPLDRRIKVCAADDCGWLFLDTSKNGTRRWCDMADCGNRAKAARFYERKRER